MVGHVFREPLRVGYRLLLGTVPGSGAYIGPQGLHGSQR